MDNGDGPGGRWVLKKKTKRNPTTERFKVIGTALQTEGELGQEKLLPLGARKASKGRISSYPEIRGDFLSRAVTLTITFLKPLNLTPQIR